jgi:hypothetical protein
MRRHGIEPFDPLSPSFAPLWFLKRPRRPRRPRPERVDLSHLALPVVDTRHLGGLSSVVGIPSLVEQYLMKALYFGLGTVVSPASYMQARPYKRPDGHVLVLRTCTKDLDCCPAKMSDSRAAKYVAEHGDSSWEVDALPPNALQQIIRDAFESIIDSELVDEIKEREESDKKRLRAAAAKIAKK